MDKNSLKRLFNILTVVLVVILLASFALFLRWLAKNDEKMAENTQYEYTQSGLPEKLEYNGENYVLNENIETFLLVGIDKNEIEDDAYYTDTKADFIALLVMDNEKKTWTMVHINRDTMTNVRILGISGQKIGEKKMQIALSYSYGDGKVISIRNTANAVSELFSGLPIKNFASVKMDAVPIYNDLTGGVEVELLDDFSDIYEGFEKGKTVTLMGEQALSYVQSRSGLESPDNESRMLRQRQYITALYNKTKEHKDESSWNVNALTKIADYLVSNDSVNQLSKLADKLMEYEFLGIKTIDGESEIGEEFVEFTVDNDALKGLIAELFYEKKDG